MPIAPGTLLGPYEILRPLGAGGMGEVYLARDTRLGREVAIKALPDAFAADEQRLARFEREAKLLASLNHPNIAGIHGLEVVAQHRYLVLEYVEGETLADRLKRGPLPIDEAIDICRQIATGVEAAHESGVVHRDLKPGNVTITPGGDVKVLDFGLAKSGVKAASGSDPSLSASPTMTYAETAVGVILGTAAYMSPEQARGRGVDRRTDVWSLGCVLYECLTGKALFEGETVSDLIARILEREPDWSALPAATPPRVRELLRKCLRKDPKERLRDIGDARLELAEAFAPGAVQAVAAPATATTAAAAQRRPVWPLLLGAVLVTALATWGFARLASPRVTVEATRLSVVGPEGNEISAETPEVVISPDGRMLAFVASDSAGVSRLWVRSLSSLSARVLPGTDDAKLPFWSPDSRHLAFFASGQLKRISSEGEGLQVLCPAPNPRGGAWGPGDVLLLAPAAAGPLMRIAASGGELAPATTLDSTRGETAHRFPSFLPDGRHFLYAGLPGKDNLIDTRLGSLEGGPAPVILQAAGVAVYASPGYLLFNRSGNTMAQPFDARGMKLSGQPQAMRDQYDVTSSYSGSPPGSVSRSGVLVQREFLRARTRVDVHDRSGRVVRSLALPAGFFASAVLSPDGRRLAVTGGDAQAREIPLVLLDVERGTSGRLTFEGQFDSSPAWTPDGRIIYYGSDRTGGRNIYRKRSDGSGPEELVADVPNLFNDPNEVSPDGRTLVYRSLSGETSEDLWTLSLEGDPAPKPLLVTRYNEMDAAFSPDGRWLAYRSDESGRFEMYARDYPSLEQRVRISSAGATPTANAYLRFTRWRRDGRELYFIGGDGQSVMAAPITPGATLDAGEPQALFRVPARALGIDVSRDGERFYVLMPAGSTGRSVVTVASGWQAELAPAK
jgi:Tol biopolymer transport system component